MNGFQSIGPDVGAESQREEKRNFISVTKPSNSNVIRRGREQTTSPSTWTRNNEAASTRSPQLVIVIGIVFMLLCSRHNSTLVSTFVRYGVRYRPLPTRLITVNWSCNYSAPFRAMGAFNILWLSFDYFAIVFSCLWILDPFQMIDKSSTVQRRRLEIRSVSTSV